MSQQTKFSREEPLPGYATTDLLGRGGFGEVWKAVAPGGVAKAIKLVYGDDPKRAELELRSLNRIKDVRHPLILSIDRIEIVKGTLVIVTELGDCNLKELCLKFRGQGNAGIPQKPLLQLMYDAAEALDFIYAEHSLQHLDVKPENFLVFGKHLKIADFGVVKHIYERSASLVHGLTPVYAPPELFEGKANRHTDQYSLAIVYQEMLTGQLPFDGLSAARLATQHLKEPPHLLALPASQQPLIARALSKDPHQRFNSCVELVEELEKAVLKSALAATESKETAKPFGNGTAIAPPPSGQKPARPLPPATALPAASQPMASSQPELEKFLSGIEPQHQPVPPTIVVGIGGTAVHVMQQLRVRINERLGHLGEAPALKLLLIDSDVQQLNQINRDEDVWKEIETLAAPLRKADEYREQDLYLKRWLNRRWLYNIPRDQSTDGIRPLGRLALVSNFRRVFSSIAKSIQECSSQESAARSSESLKLPFVPGKPRIVLLSSISGGTGGGMLLDVAYAIRGKLAKAGFDGDGLEAILLHSTPRNKGRDKAVANAYATLQELEHYSLRGNYYPGDSHMGIEAFHGNNRTFREVGFVHLGVNLDEQQWKDAADDVAEYVFCSLLEKHAVNTASAEPGRLMGQFLAIQQLGAANRAFLKDVCSQMCLDMLDSWRGREVQDQNTVSFTQPTTFLNHMVVTSAAKHRRLSVSLNEQIEGIGLSVDYLLKQVSELLAQEVGKKPKTYIEEMVRESLQIEADLEMGLANSALKLIDHLLSAEEAEDGDESGENTLFATLSARSETLAGKLAAELRGWLQQLVNEPKSRVDGAQYAAEQAHHRIQEFLSSVARDIARVREKTDGLKLSISNDFEESNSHSRWIPFRTHRHGKLAAILIEYGNAKLHTIVLSVVHKQLRTIEAQVGVTIDQTQRLSHDLTRLSKKFESPRQASNMACHAFDESVAWYVQGVREKILSKRLEIIQHLEGVIEGTLARNGYTLQGFLDSRVELSDILLLPMREHSRDVVSRAVAAIHCELIDGDGDQLRDGGTFQLPQLIHNLIQGEWPVGPRGQEEVSVVIPQSADAARLRSQLLERGDQISVVNLITNGITLIRQIQNVSLYDYLRALTQGADVYKDLASRLHSRDDVNWSPLLPPEDSANSGGPLLSEDVNVDQTAVMQP